MNEYLFIQQRINHYSCYVKHMINGFCEEFQTNKVHSRRLTSVLDRLFAKENHTFLNFFVDEKLSITAQFIQYLNAQGEIIHMGESYYALPPERTIVLPDGQNVLISSLQLNDGQVGLGKIIAAKSPIFINYNEYVFLPSFEQIFKHYQNRLSNHHDVEPSEMIIFNERGSFKSTKINNMQDREYYLLKFERLIGSQIKSENYFAQWRNKEWFVVQIVNGMYLRIRMALRDRKKLNTSYSLINRKGGFIEVKLQYSIPKEEDILLRLIATPKENKWSKSYLTTESQLENVRAIFAYCKLKELEVNNNGIYN